MSIETMTVPVISTAHLPGDFAVADLGVLHAAYDYGYFVWMDPDNGTDWFVKIREWAASHAPDGWGSASITTPTRFPSSPRTTGRRKSMSIEPFTTIRYADRNGRHARITYHPEWSVSQPWVSYIEGSAGRHFENEKQADSYFEGLGFKKAMV